MKCIWRLERGDWKNSASKTSKWQYQIHVKRRNDWKNSAYQICEEIAGMHMDEDVDDMGTFGVMEQEELEKACKDNGVPPLLIARALNAEFETQGASRRQKIHQKLEKILSEEWGDMDKAVKAEKKRKQEIFEVRS